ncbi:MAG: hypothetical protein RIF32_18490, partial [Leptospirales bacterium]
DHLRRESIVAMGRTAPNPAVAAVVVAATPAGRKIFSGGTEPPGARHAEIVALDAADSWTLADSAESSRVLKKSSSPNDDALPAEVGAGPRRIYVRLEPCSHHGRTPPCTDRILSYSKLRSVIVFAPDKSLPESGREILRGGGRRVVLLKPENSGAAFRADEFLFGFQSRVAGEGPRLHYKQATTSDGVLGLRNRRLMISGARALWVGQLLRAKLDALVVGPGTIGVDFPSLALRSAELSGVSPESQAKYKPGPGGGSESFVREGPELRQPGNGGDWFWDSLFQYAAAVRSAIAADSAAYQPARVFILGRPRETAADFLRRQLELTVETGRAPVFAFLPDCRNAWRSLFSDLRNASSLRRVGPGSEAREKGVAAFDVNIGFGLKGAAELPALTDPAFAARLRESLGEAGFNEVMVEGGAGLLSALQSGSRPQDRAYLLRSKRALADFPNGSDRDLETVMLPDWLAAGPPAATYDLGEDVLEVRFPGRED